MYFLLITSLVFITSVPSDIVLAHSTHHGEITNKTIFHAWWDEEDEDWNYLPKGDQNALHDGCFIKSKDIKYKLEMLIKINN